MPWNWQLADWPHFHYQPDCIVQQEKKFLLSVGSSSAFLKKIEEQDRQQFIVEILSSEGEQSSRIEGETLDRASLQSSIKKHFGLSVPVSPKHLKETGMSHLLCDVYESYEKPLTHEMLWEWHRKLFQEQSLQFEAGKYREPEEPMQIVSHRLDAPQVFFEAPPSHRVLFEMDRFIQWYNASEKQLSILGRAAIAHLYFENIHPFEDGNGRIGRALVEKSLSQGGGCSILIAVSQVLEKRKKEYYKALEACNQTLEATAWVEFFADVVLQAQEDSLKLLNFIMEKSHLLGKLADNLNSRQEKALLRMFQEGPNGFEGGLNAEKYIAITGASRATATRDLAELVALQALLKTGELRHTRYWLNIKY